MTRSWLDPRPWLLALVLATSAVAHARLQPAAPDRADLSHVPPLAVGDWVLRSGTGADSRVIHQLDGGEYSHIGMVVSLTPRVLIAHATTDDDPARLNQVLVSPFEEFVRPSLARGFAIGRPEFLAPDRRPVVAAKLLEERGLAFRIEPRERAHRYCTTLLADAIRTEHAAFAPAWTHVSLAFHEGEYLLPRAFAEYPGVRWIHRQ